MKKRVKLITSLISFAIVIAIMSVGVMAATSLSVSFSNSITYIASAHARATISATKSAGTNTSFENGTETNPSPITLTGSGDESGQVLEIGDVVLEAIDSSTGTIVYSYAITVLNNASSTDEFKYLTVTFTSPEIKAYATGSYGQEQLPRLRQVKLYLLAKHLL